MPITDWQTNGGKKQSAGLHFPNHSTRLFAFDDRGGGNGWASH
jgi:hypothetical protein